MKRFYLAVVLACLILPGLIFAQGVTSAAFSGTVVDAEGKGLPGAHGHGQALADRNRLRDHDPARRAIRHPRGHGRRSLHRHRDPDRLRPPDAGGHHPEAGREPQPHIQADAGPDRSGRHRHRPQPGDQPVAHGRRAEREHGRHREHALDRPHVRRLRPSLPAGRLRRRRRLQCGRPEQQVQQHPDRRRREQRPVRPERQRHARPGRPDLARRRAGVPARPRPLRRPLRRLHRGRPERDHPLRHQLLLRLGLLLRPQPELHRQGPR